MYLVAGCITQSVEPAATPVTMVPPLPLYTRNIGAEEEVTAPLHGSRAGEWARHDLTAEAELVNAAITAVGAVQEERHSGIDSHQNRVR